MTLRRLVTLEDLGDTCGVLRETWGVEHDALDEHVGEGERLHRMASRDDLGLVRITRDNFTENLGKRWASQDGLQGRVGIS